MPPLHHVKFVRAVQLAPERQGERLAAGRHVPPFAPCDFILVGVNPGKHVDPERVFMFISRLAGIAA
jgi:hypothetical protein